MAQVSARVVSACWIYLLACSFIRSMVLNEFKGVSIELSWFNWFDNVYCRHDSSFAFLLIFLFVSRIPMCKSLYLPMKLVASF